jgi:hypothetical protein
MSNPYINCKVGRYHWFKVISSDNLAQHEVCKFCHLKQSYGFKSDGTMVDSQKYFMDHIRAFAQPSMGEVYYDINPGDMEKFLIVDKNVRTSSSSR